MCYCNTLGKVLVKKYSMGVCNSPDIFQEKISELFEGFDILRLYIDNVLLIKDKEFTDHLKS